MAFRKNGSVEFRGLARLAFIEPEAGGHLVGHCLAPAVLFASDERKFRALRVYPDHDPVACRDLVRTHRNRAALGFGCGFGFTNGPVSYTHLRDHETSEH